MPGKKVSDDGFNFQLELLKQEIVLTDRAIERIDGITQTVKNWAVVTWAGSIAAALGDKELRQFILFTMVLPLIFWYIDGYWRYLQKRSIFRQQKISDFVNSDDFIESFRKKQLMNFVVLDPKGNQHRDTNEYRSTVNLRKTLFYKEVGRFYLSLATVSALVGLYFLLAVK